MSIKIGDLVEQCRQVNDTSGWKEDLYKDVEDKLSEVKESRFSKCKK